VARIGIKVCKRAQGVRLRFFSGTLASTTQGMEKGQAGGSAHLLQGMNETGGNMKSRKILTCMTAMTLFSALGVPIRLAAQTNYSVVDLAGLGGNAGGANSINNRGWVTGADNLAGDELSNAVLWVKGSPINLGTLGGPNSAVAWPVKNNNGVIVGISETAENDPLGEAFSCWPFFAAGVPTGRICKGFRWENGTMTSLPPFPGGYSSYATAANNRGQVVGWAENGVHDPTCNPLFQILQFRAAIWGPNGDIQELPPLPGDSTSAATAINDYGQVVGISGDCGFAVGSVSAKHAVLWENGVPIDLGNIGGDAWNTPTAINNQGMIVGFANTVPGVARTYEAFIWTKAGGMKSLGKLPGDLRSAAFGLNEKGQVVGLDRGGPFGIRAFLWENGKLTDLNSLTLTGSPYLLLAGDVNQSGVIVGEAFHPDTLQAPGYVATPVPARAGASSAMRQTPQGNLPDNVRQQIERRLGFASELVPITP
jgi:probable HAF family extracellular repeat protein